MPSSLVLISASHSPLFSSSFSDCFPLNLWPLSLSPSLSSSNLLYFCHAAQRCKNAPGCETDRTLSRRVFEDEGRKRREKIERWRWEERNSQNHRITRSCTVPQEDRMTRKQGGYQWSAICRGQSRVKSSIYFHNLPIFWLYLEMNIFDKFPHFVLVTLWSSSLTSISQLTKVSGSLTPLNSILYPSL